jgi:hypothetical protein
MEADERIQYVIQHTEIVRLPKQSLATFGTTNIYYYVLTELAEKINAVREGKVTAENPKIVTPSYLINLEGFTESAGEFLNKMIQKYPYEPALFYRYKNEPKELNIVSDSPEAVIHKLNEKIDREKNTQAAIIKGALEELWDVSLLKFAYELTEKSLRHNIFELQIRGLFDIDPAGIPRQARWAIEQLFTEVERDKTKAPELEAELRRWGLFTEYQDRFFALFKRRR